MKVFTEDNLENLQSTCILIGAIVDNLIEDHTMLIQLEFLNNHIKEFVNNPIIANSGILVERDDSCCMACKYWRYTRGGVGECMYFNNNIYTEEGFSCKGYSEGDYNKT